nr:hypothetical protein [uncultured Undibacterium sp.]
MAIANKCVLSLLLLLMAAPSLADNKRLSFLAKQDQAVRTGATETSSDDARRREVLELLASGGVATPIDKFNAGLVLQHTGLNFCDGKLKSISPENYLLAHFLFKDALTGGVEFARTLVAASIDRYLSFTEGRQLYGTNRVIDQTTGKELLVPIDRTISDKERAKFGVPPLAELLEKWPEQKKE